MPDRPLSYRPFTYGFKNRDKLVNLFRLEHTVDTFRAEVGKGAFVQSARIDNTVFRKMVNDLVEEFDLVGPEIGVLSEAAQCVLCRISVQAD